MTWLRSVWLAHSLSSILSEDEEKVKTNDLFWQSKDDEVFHEPQIILIAHHLPSPQRAVGDCIILNKWIPKRSCDSHPSSTSKAITSPPRIKGAICMLPKKNLSWAINEKSLIGPIRRGMNFKNKSTGCNLKVWDTNPVAKSERKKKMQVQSSQASCRERTWWPKKSFRLNCKIQSESNCIFLQYIDDKLLF